MKIPQTRNSARKDPEIISSRDLGSPARGKTVLTALNRGFWSPGILSTPSIRPESRFEAFRGRVHISPARGKTRPDPLFSRGSEFRKGISPSPRQKLLERISAMISVDAAEKFRHGISYLNFPPASTETFAENFTSEFLRTGDRNFHGKFCLGISPCTGQGFLAKLFGRSFSAMGTEIRPWNFVPEFLSRAYRKFQGPAKGGHRSLLAMPPSLIPRASFHRGVTDLSLRACDECVVAAVNAGPTRQGLPLESVARGGLRGANKAPCRCGRGQRGE